MVQWLVSDLGVMHQNGMGNSALTYVDVVSWAQVTRTDVRPWEARLLVKASRAYVIEFEAAKSNSAPEPNANKEHQRRMVAEQVRAMFRK